MRGIYFEETNERCLGILSAGRPPLSSNDVKLSVGSTRKSAYTLNIPIRRLTERKHRVVRKVDVSNQVSSGTIETGRGHVQWMIQGEMNIIMERRISRRIKAR